MQLYGIDRHDLKDSPVRPSYAACAEIGDIRREFICPIRKQDILVHHPYESLVRWSTLKTAARDPDVLAIKQTLYRGAQPTRRAGIARAVENGKQVACAVGAEGSLR
jgi:polyphosphate kinase